MTRLWQAFLVCLWLVPGVHVAQAHESMPASLLLDQQVDGRWNVRWRLPQMQGAAPEVAPVFPAACEMSDSPQTDALPGARLQRWAMRCTVPLGTGQHIAFDGLAATSIDVVVRLAFSDGRVVTHIARPRSPDVQLGGQLPAQGLSVSSYFGLGVDHILSGTDHLLFVLCLILLLPHWSGLLKTITAFTLAHSITLALSAFGWVHVAQLPVEATIALSILFLARELAVRHTARLTVQRPWAVAFAFGLLHGFGFAGALAEVGLAQGDIPTALLLFNLGVEAGQLAFVVVVVPLVLLARRWARNNGRRLRWVQAAPVYAIGGVASFWFLQRMQPIVGLQWI